MEGGSPEGPLTQPPIQLLATELQSRPLVPSAEPSFPRGRLYPDADTPKGSGGGEPQEEPAIKHLRAVLSGSTHAEGKPQGPGNFTPALPWLSQDLYID